MIKDKPIRADLKFCKELEEIKLNRLKYGTDRTPRPKSDRRLTQAITRHKLWQVIKQDMIKAEMID